MSNPNSMVVGEKGKTYGLVIKSKPAQPTQKNVLKPSPFFNNDEDEKPETMQEAIQKAQNRKSILKQTALYEQALEEDPNIFDYDGVYDSMKQAETIQVKEKQAKAADKRPKYMDEIQKAHEFRKKEEEIVYFKKLQKEQEKEREIFGETEKFVTSGYKKKLAEAKKWEEEQAKKEAQVADVSKSGGFDGFFSNFINQRAAEKAATINASSSAAKAALEKPKATISTSKANVQENQHIPTSTLKVHDKPKPKEDEEAISRKRKQDAEEEETRKREKLQREEEEKKRKEKEEEENRKQKEAEEAKKLARRNDDKAVAEARARYLARKQQQQLQQADAETNDKG